MPLVSNSSNLEQLKNQAKDLLRAVRAAEPQAQSRVAAHLPHLVGLSPTPVDNAAHALDHFADDRCVGPLRQLVDDPVPRVRRMALHVLSCDVCKLALLSAVDDLVALVIDRALADPSIQVRRHATVALGGVGRDTRVEHVLQTLAAQETDPAIRREARQAVRRHRARALA
jgi:HEAT repeat protein